MLFSLTVGRVDAGQAILVTPDHRLIEFPSILLPPDIRSGSIVAISVSRNAAAEAETDKEFGELQSTILSTFGARNPSAPVLRCRNITQTSIVLEWDPIDAATAAIRSLAIYRDGNKIGPVNKPDSYTTTKISGLAIEKEYRFQMVLRTSAGTYSSNLLKIKTHAMTNLTGITITPGSMAGTIRAVLVADAERIGARINETIRIDTTHFVCTEARGALWEEAHGKNIAIVVPDWLKACEAAGKIIGVAEYYLNADPKARKLGPSIVGQNNSSFNERPRTPPKTPGTRVIPPTPEQPRPDVPPKDTPRQLKHIPPVVDDDESDTEQVEDEEAPAAAVAEQEREETAAKSRSPSLVSSPGAGSDDDDDHEDPSAKSYGHYYEEDRAWKRPTVEDAPEDLEDNNFDDVTL